VTITESKNLQIIPIYQNIDIADLILALDLSNIRSFIGISKSDLPPDVEISMPIVYPKQISKSIMEDGSFRWGLYRRLRKWEISWARLTETELGSLINLYAKNQPFWWQNTDESLDWYPIIIEDFFFDVIDPISLIKLYKGGMVFKEVA
jgi:hypothetical protein